MCYLNVFFYILTSLHSDTVHCIRRLVASDIICCLSDCTTADDGTGVMEIGIGIPVGTGIGINL